MTVDGTPQASPNRVLCVALARAANTLFFLVTAIYCLLTYNSFAYQQFIRPHLVASLSSFVVWHHLWHWVLLAVTAWTLVPDLRSPRGRYVAWAYLVAMTLVGLFILAKPLLPEVENNALGLRLAFAFLVPPIWLAVVDHLSTAPAFHPDLADRRRVVIAAVAAACVLWIIHVVAAPLRFTDLGDLTMSRAGLAFGAVTSFVVHVGLFTAFALVTIGGLTIARMAGIRGSSDYWTVALLSVLGLWLVAARLVFASLSFRGPSAWLLALQVAVALTAAWSGVASRIAVSRGGRLSALDAWFSPLPGSGSPIAAAFALAGLSCAGFFVIERATTFDWDFLIQNLCVVGVWIGACGLTHTLVRNPMSGARLRSTVVTAGMLLLLGGVGGNVEAGLAAHPARAAFVPEFALDGYAAVDPSYRLIRHLLRVDPGGAAGFYGYLHANSLIGRVPIDPIDVDFVKPLTKAPGKPPHIFFFVIDSLRRDYVSAYNPDVTFTPSVAKFAAEGYAFNRAFTRYGGTGLSMPAIWTGGMVVHKEYVLPYGRMNALEKLLTANGYRTLISMDHITEQLLAPASAAVELDRGRPEMQYDFCTTLTELESKLHAPDAPLAPIFAHTRSLNLHVSKLTNRSVSFEYSRGGFQVPAAEAIQRMDRCFGGFVDFLKREGLYDDSIVILTSDHGDSLGEASRWGHAYTLVPEVIRTPLLIHLPAALRDRFTASVDDVAFSTDITPTLYTLLGYSPVSLGWAYGAPLFVPPGTDQSWRARATFLLASSYGPVYGLLRDNGKALYIADGVNRRDYAYDMTGVRPARIGVTGELRSASWAFIRARLKDLAAMYHFVPEI
jgi:hypothetical protein